MKTTQTLKIGDCLELIKEIPDESVDLVVTDPPYGIGVASWDIFDPTILQECHRVLKPGHAMFMYFSQRRIPYIQPLFEQYFTLKNIIVERKKNMVCTTWDKNALQIQWEPIFFGMKAGEVYIEVNKRKFEIGLYGDIIEATVPQSNFKGLARKQHKCQKDIEVINTLVQLQSNEDDLVLDPFAGSGTTLRACRGLNRNCLSFEIDPNNKPMIIERTMANIPQLDTFAEV